MRHPMSFSVSTGSLSLLGSARQTERQTRRDAMTTDPLLQPYRLKHLTLKNRIMTTAHEPAYAEDGLPKDRYRAYHAERAKGGVAMVMTAGSALVSRDSPASFGNLQAWRDEIVPWMAKLADECHGYGCAVMIQLTHLAGAPAGTRVTGCPSSRPLPCANQRTAPFPR